MDPNVESLLNADVKVEYRVSPRLYEPGALESWLNEVGADGYEVEFVLPLREGTQGLGMPFGTIVYRDAMVAVAYKTKVVPGNAEEESEFDGLDR